jgi:DNA-binding transcriptional ArsR family regulator
MKSVKSRAGNVSDSHVAALKALAHAGRLELFFHLVRAKGEVTPGELQEALEIPAPTLSHQLDQLWRAGLLNRRREERHIYYTVHAPAVGELIRLLTACC